MDFLKKYAGPGVLVLAQAALQLSGYESLVLAIALLAGAVLWFVLVRFPDIRNWILRRPPLPPDPTPAALPTTLFTITLPRQPRPGHINSNRTIMFENVYVVTSATRELRFELLSPGREFLGFLDYHEVWREEAAKSDDFAAKYMANPAHIEFPNRSGHLAFIDRNGVSSGVGDEWTLRVDTGQDRDRHRFEIVEIGQWACLSDGSIEQVAE